MYPRWIKKNEPTDGEDRFLRSLGHDNWKAESQELNSLNIIVIRKQSSGAPSAGVRWELHLPKAGTRMSHQMSHCYCHKEILVRPPVQTLRELVVKRS